MRTFLAIALLIMTAAAAHADGTVYFVEGTVLVNGQAVRQGVEVHSGDRVTTGAASRAFLLLDGSKNVRLDANTEVVLVPTEQSTWDRVKMSAGRVWVEVTKWGRAESPLEVETPQAVAAVRGTVFEVSVNGTASSEVRVHEGEVAVSRDDAVKTTLTQTAGTAVEATSETTTQAVYTLDAWATYNLEAGAERAIDHGVDLVVDAMASLRDYLEQMKSLPPKERREQRKGPELEVPEGVRRKLASYLAVVRVTRVSESGWMGVMGIRAGGRKLLTAVKPDDWVYMKDGQVHPLVEVPPGTTGIAVLPVRMIVTDSASIEPSRAVIKERITLTTSKLARGKLDRLDGKELVMLNAKGEELRVAVDKLGTAIALVVNGRRVTRQEFAGAVKQGTPCLWIKRNNRWAVLLALP